MAGTYKTEVKNAPSKHLCYSFTVAKFFSTVKFSNVRQRYTNGRKMQTG